MTSYVVTAEAVNVYNADRTRMTLVHKGGTLPSDSDPDHVKLLLDRGMVEEGDVVGGVDSPDVAPPFPLPEGAGDESGAPAKSASKAEWVDYAVSQGADREEAEASTKDDLIATYGG